MSPVWQPVQNPPQLDKFCHLSHDAQIVMAALHRKYLERKEEILRSKSQLPGASDYYRAMYAEKFGVCVQRQNTGDIQSVSSGQRALPQTAESTEGSFLNSEQSTPQILQQTAASSERLDVCSIPSITRNHFGSVQATPNFHKQPPERSNLQTPLYDTPKKLETCRVLFPDMKSTGNEELNFVNYNETENNLYSRTTPHEIIGSVDSLQSKTSVCSEETLDESQERRENSDISPVNNNSVTLLPGSPSLFSQDCVSSSDKLVINDGSNITNTESFIKFLERRYQEEFKNVDIPVPDPISKQNTDNVNMETFKCIDKTEKPGLLDVDKKRMYESKQVTEKVQKRKDGTPLNTSSVIKTPRSCSITERLDDHKKIRQLFNKENSGLLKQSTIDGHGKIKKKSNTSTFEIPFKKKRIEPEELVGKQMTSMSPSQIDVGSLSSQELDNVTDLILQCDEVVISLIYKDGSTQLREMTSGPSNKKKINSTKLHSPEEVKSLVQLQSSNKVSSIAIMPKLTKESNKVYIFQLEYKEENLQSWNKTFWENFLYGSNRKVCYKSKDLINTVVKIFNLEQSKVSTECAVLDPMVAAWLLDPDKNAMEFNEAITVFGFQYKDVVDVQPTEMLKTDLYLLSKLMEKLYQELKNKELWQLFYYVENTLVSLLAVMELRQIKINTNELVKFSDVLKKKIIKLEKKAHSTVGHSFLLNSHAQLRQVLFEELNLASKLPQKTKLAKTSVGHQTSTSESVLNQLVDFHPLPSIVLEHRQIQKLKSTYIDGMMSCVRDGYISTHWDQTSAATGRLSSYQPNVQAIPKTPVTITDYQDNFIIGKENSNNIEVYARDPFISHEGWSFLAADFQQIELRILAHLSNDPSLLKIFQKSKNGDIFLELASQWLNKPVKDVTLSDREQTKRVVYSVMYGAGKEKLAEYLKISSENAKAIINSFLVKFPSVNQLTRKCIEFCQKNGYTKTIFKRRRNFPNINHHSPPMRAQTERQAFNFCVQGSAADLCKAAMLQIELALRRNQNVRARLLVQIHDELLLEVADEDLSTVQDIVRTVMEDDKGLCGDMVELKVPLKISLNVGKTWGHMTPV